MISVALFARQAVFRAVLVYNKMRPKTCSNYSGVVCYSCVTARLGSALQTSTAQTESATLLGALPAWDGWMQSAPPCPF